MTVDLFGGILYRHCAAFSLFKALQTFDTYLAGQLSIFESSVRAYLHSL